MSIPFTFLIHLWSTNKKKTKSFMIFACTTTWWYRLKLFRWKTNAISLSHSVCVEWQKNVLCNYLRAVKIGIHQQTDVCCSHSVALETFDNIKIVHGRNIMSWTNDNKQQFSIWLIPVQIINEIFFNSKSHGTNK